MWLMDFYATIYAADGFLRMIYVADGFLHNDSRGSRIFTHRSMRLTDFYAMIYVADRLLRNNLNG
jgi:hypothetical protein